MSQPNDHDLETEVSRLRNRVLEMERELDVFKQGAPRSRDKNHVNPDAEWRCVKCNAFLGMYDPVTDVLRLRYKDFSTWMRVGPGGFVTVVCRGCTEQNTQSYTEESGEQPGAAG